MSPSSTLTISSSSSHQSTQLRFYIDMCEISRSQVWGPILFSRNYRTDAISLLSNATSTYTLYLRSPRYLLHLPLAYNTSTNLFASRSIPHRSSSLGNQALPPVRRRQNSQTRPVPGRSSGPSNRLGCMGLSTKRPRCTPPS